MIAGRQRSSRGPGWALALVALVLVTVTADRARAQDAPAAPTDRLAVVVLIQGDEGYLGNVASADVCGAYGCPYPARLGAYDVLAAALGTSAPAAAGAAPTIAGDGPPGAVGALLVYGRGVDVRRPMGPLATLTGASLGGRKRQLGVHAQELVLGLRRAGELLAATTARRRLLIVISDGVDPSAAPGNVRAVARDLARAQVEVHPVRLIVDRTRLDGPARLAALANLEAFGPVAWFDDETDLRRHLVDLLWGRVAPTAPGAAPGPATPAAIAPLALVVLVEGHEYYIGNHRTYPRCPEPDCEEGRTEGLHAALTSALGSPGGAATAAGPTPISQLGPPGSLGALLVYGDGVDVRRSMADLRTLTGATLGPQARQSGVYARDLVVGLRAAQAQLAQVHARRKLLLVIGDGVDDAAGAAELARVADELARARIGVASLTWLRGGEFIGDRAPFRDEGRAALRALGDHGTFRSAYELPALIGPLFTAAERRATALGAGGQRLDDAAAGPLATGRRWWLASPSPP